MRRHWQLRQNTLILGLRQEVAHKIALRMPLGSNTGLRGILGKQK